MLSEVPTRDFDRAVDLANLGRWGDALMPARAAAAADPAISPYNLVAGLAAAHSGDHAGATTYFRRVAQQDDLAEAWLNLAAEQAQLGLTDDAATSLDRALRLGDQRPEVALPAGDLALQLGLTDLATDAFARAITENPTLAGDPWWQTDARRAAIFPKALAQALAGAGSDGQWSIAVLAGDLDAASRFAPQSSDPDYAARIIAAWSGDAAARDALLGHCSREPLDIGALVWCARVADRAETPVARDQYRQQLETISSGSSASTLMLRVKGADSAHLYVGPTGASWWAIYTYRRLGPIDVLVPSLAHLVLM
jgi:tetratricopeptide (TPR) repeat protein